MATYTARIVELDGTVVRTLGNCNIEDYSPGLNDNVGAATITIPKYEVDRSGSGGVNEVGQYADLTTPGREVQILRNGTVVWRGPAIRRQPSSDNGSVSIELAGSGWYFGRRVIDAPLRNLLADSNMESAPLTSWTTSGTLTATAETSVVRRGAKSLRLVGASTFAENYKYQSITYTGTAEIGTELTVAGWIYIHSWTGPAFENRGLYIEQLDTGVVTTHNFAVVDDATAQGTDTWIRLECTTWVPPSATRTIIVRLYAPNGNVVWDEVELVEPVSLAVDKTPEDVATTANRIVTFAQDSTYSKSDLHIATTTAPTTGKTFVFPRAWQFAEHTPVDRALNDDIVALGVLDWEITPDTKTFTMYTPRKGIDRGVTPFLVSTVTLALGTNLASYSLDEDGSQVETDVTFLGDGDGPDREEGRQVDTSATSGLVLQGVYPASPGTTIDKLDDLAAEKLTHVKQLVRVLTVTTVEKSGGLIGLLGMGDIVEAVIDDGVVQVSGDWRVVSIKVTPKTETMELVLNEEL